jgi:hypothetical protein
VSAPVEDEGAALAEAEAALARDEQRLLSALGSTQQAPELDRAGARDDEPPTDTPRASPSTPAEKTPSAPGASRASGAESIQAAKPPCELACRALASMRRSQERVCELTADDDARCKRARERVKRAQERVDQAGCGCDPDAN